MKTGYDLGFLVKNDVKKSPPAAGMENIRKNTIIFARKENRIE
mgnify:CR=1 FL=1